MCVCLFFFKQKTAYEMRISDWSSDVCSSDLGLPDVLTTVNGREVFSTIGRNFDLQDMPAEALSRVNVFKSQTADLTEGGLAGVIDLQLNRPFNFRDPTVVLRSEEHTSELQSLMRISYAVFCLKKKNRT